MHDINKKLEIWQEFEWETMLNKCEVFVEFYFLFFV